MPSPGSPIPQNKAESLGRPKVIRRAKVACKACNARRVRCDVVQSHPCWHCRNRDTVCEIIESRRGKYQRTQRHRRPTRVAEPDVPVGGPNRVLLPASDLIDTTQTKLSGDDQRQSLGAMDLDTSPSQIFTPDQDDLDVRSNHEQGPETLYARMADPEITESHHDQSPEQNSGTLYLGEAFSLTFVVKTVCSPSSSSAAPLPTKVHYPVPISASETRSNDYGSGRQLDHDILALLQTRGALTTPPKEIGDALVSIFFRSFHPAYPVFDRKEFQDRYNRGNMSLLALQTIYFLAATICDELLLQKAGFKSRDHARKTFYMRAKLLYDADYEQDKTILTATLFLLGFWWQQPQDQKDTWYWLGCAISLAQTLGMHRTTVNSTIGQRSRSLWKRIWWSIYIRDRHASASLGRPCRIRDEDCDIESLSEADFQTDVDTELSITGHQEGYHVSYFMHMSKLAVLLGQVLTIRFSPLSNRDDDIIATAGTNLYQWEKALPQCMARHPLRDDLDAAFWAANLHACYHNTEILLYRPTCIVATPGTQQDSTDRAMNATYAITRIAEDLLTAGTLRLGQLHLIPALFAALGIHAIVIRGADKVRKKVAENRAGQCMLALGELSKSWPVGGWILRLFQTLMARLTNRYSQGDTQHLLNGTSSQFRDHPQPNARPSPLASMNVEDGTLGLWQADTINVTSSVPIAGEDNFYNFDLIFQDSFPILVPEDCIFEDSEFL